MHIRLDFPKENCKIVGFFTQSGSDSCVFLSNWKLDLAIFYHTLYTEKDQFYSDHLHQVPTVWIINAYALINAYFLMHIVGCNFEIQCKCQLLVCMFILSLYNSHTLKYLWDHRVARLRVQWGDQHNTFSSLKAFVKAEINIELWESLIDSNRK